jgi:endonuclease YncB( thermonuclease family)
MRSLLLFTAIIGIFARPAGDAASAWQSLAPGIDTRLVADAKITIVRIDPKDSSGRILFIFSRTPFSMHDFNRELLSAGIGLVAAQHLEGGPEAQLYLHVGKAEQEMFGSFETSFHPNDANPAPWPIPNVLGVRAR